MKTWTFLAVALSLTINSFSQDNGYVSLNLGPSIPIGDFGSSAINNEHAGLAKTGFFADLSFGYKLGENIGIGATLRSQSNAYDADAVISFYQLLDPSLEFRDNSGPWTCSGLLGGLYGSFPIKGITSFDFRGFIGFMSCKTPELDMVITSMGFTESLNVPSSSSTAFAYLLGVGLKIDVGDKVCLNTGIDLVGTSPEFKMESYGTGQVQKFTQSISTINIGFGVGLRL